MQAKQKSKHRPNNPSRGTNPFPSIFEKEGQMGELYEMYEAHSDFVQYLEKLDNTIKNVLVRHQTLIKGRYLSATQHLEKVRKSLTAYHQRMLKLQEELNNDAVIKTIVKQIENFQSFYHILQEKLNDLETAIQSKETECNELISKMQEKKGILMQVHQDNIKLSTKILSYKKFLNQNKPSGDLYTSRLSAFLNPSNSEEPIKSAQLNLKKIQKEFTSLKYETEHLSLDNETLKAQLSRKSNRFINTKQSFLECFQTLNRSLMLSQQVANNASGLKNSLLFKITAPSVKSIGLNKTLAVFKQCRRNTFLQDREITNVVYSTLQKVVRDRKEPTKDPLQGLTISWEEFKEFTPLQILGVLALSPEIRESMTFEMDVKERKINKFLSSIVD